jgi:hypothetical protein
VAKKQQDAVMTIDELTENIITNLQAALASFQEIANGLEE